MRGKLLLWLLLVILVLSNGGARSIKAQAPQPSTLKERVVIPKPAATTLHDGLLDDVFVLKFREGSHIRLQQDQLVFDPGLLSPAEEQLLSRANLDQDIVKQELSKVNALFLNTPGLQVVRMFGRPEGDLDKEKQEGEQASGEELADLNLYYYILHSGATREQTAQMIDQLNARAIVEIAYPQPIPAPAGVDLPPTTPNFTANQNYFDAAPLGIDVGYARSFPGGRGEGVRLIDIETGWHLDHEDLPNERSLIHNHGWNWSYHDHGTAVLGILAAEENGHGITGIVPRIGLGVDSPVAAIPPYDVPGAINRAAAALRPGDIILLEQQYSFGPNGAMVPVEFSQGDFDAIQAATSRSRIVVEAAANGSQDLDSDFYAGRFTRDSGAIMVGAGTPGSRMPEWFTNYGSRVDVHGWGSGIMTLGYNDLPAAPGDVRQRYTTGFGGTSGASPIVSGAAALVQSIRMARGLPVLLPAEMRELLKQTGTPQARDAKQIGPLPNLRAAIERTTMDLFVMGSDGRVQRTAWAANRGWDSWAALGTGRFAPETPVSAIARSASHVDVFAVGQDRRVWTSAWDVATGWLDWQPLGSQTFTRNSLVSAVSRQPKMVDIFVVDGNGRIWTTWYQVDSGWGWWYPVGTDTFRGATSIAAISRNANQLDLFIIGGDGRVYTTWWSGTEWGSWYPVGAGSFAVGTPLTAIARTPDVMDLFAVGLNGQVWTIWWDATNGWGSWYPVGAGSFNQGTTVTAVARTPNQLDLFAVGQDGRVWSTWWPSDSGWAGWFPIDTRTFPQRAVVSAVARAHTHLDLFVAGSDGQVWSSWWDARSGWASWFSVQRVAAIPAARAAVTQR